MRQLTALLVLILFVNQSFAQVDTSTIQKKISWDVQQIKNKPLNSLPAGSLTRTFTDLGRGVSISIQTAQSALTTASTAAQGYKPQSSWDAATNSPNLAALGLTNTSADIGKMWYVNVPGTSSITGQSLPYSVGDMVVWNGTTWVKLVRSDLALSKALSLEAKLPIVNYFDQTKGADASTLNGNGVKSTGGSFGLGEAISVTPGETMYFYDSVGSGGKINFYSGPVNTSNYATNHIAGSQLTTTATATFVVPAGAVWLVPNYLVARKSSTQLRRIPPDGMYVPFGYSVANNIQLKGSDISTDATHRLVSDSEKNTWNSKLSPSDVVNNISGATGNLFDKSKGGDGYYSGYKTGTLVAASVFSYSDIIPVIPGETYTGFGSSGMRFTTHYDRNKNVITSGNIGSNSTITTFVVPDNVFYVRFSYYTAQKNNFMFKKSATVDEYEPYNQGVNTLVSVNGATVPVTRNEFVFDKGRETDIYGQNILFSTSSLSRNRTAFDIKPVDRTGLITKLSVVTVAAGPGKIIIGNVDPNGLVAKKVYEYNYTFTNGLNELTVANFPGGAGISVEKGQYIGLETTSSTSQTQFARQTPSGGNSSYVHTGNIPLDSTDVVSVTSTQLQIRAEIQTSQSKTVKDYVLTNQSSIGDLSKQDQRMLSQIIWNSRKPITDIPLGKQNKMVTLQGALRGLSGWRYAPFTRNLTSNVEADPGQEVWFTRFPSWDPGKFVTERVAGPGDTISTGVYIITPRVAGAQASPIINKKLNVYIIGGQTGDVNANIDAHFRVVGRTLTITDSTKGQGTFGPYFQPKVRLTAVSGTPIVDMSSAAIKPHLEALYGPNATYVYDRGISTGPEMRLIDKGPYAGKIIGGLQMAGNAHAASIVMISADGGINWDLYGGPNPVLSTGTGKRYAEATYFWDETYLYALLRTNTDVSTGGIGTVYTKALWTDLNTWSAPVTKIDWGVGRTSYTYNPKFGHLVLAPDGSSGQVSSESRTRMGVYKIEGDMSTFTRIMTITTPDAFHSPSIFTDEIGKTSALFSTSFTHSQENGVGCNQLILIDFDTTYFIKY